MARLHQFVPTLEPGAVGTHMMELQRLVRDELGLEGELFAEFVDPSLTGAAHRHTDYGRRIRARPDDVLIYHMAVGSHVADFVLERRQRMVVDHHNITPPEYYAGWEPAAVYACEWGRAQFPLLAQRAVLGVADSPFNETELAAAGCRRTATAPILLDTDRLRRTVVDGADPEVSSRLLRAKAGGGTDWLFVGRVAPNKCQHDLIRAFAAYRRVWDGAARLHIVGGSASPAYTTALEGLVHSLGLGEAVHMTGPVTGPVLAAHYAGADVFVCLSEHEGFCVPLLESMAARVPIVAFASSAVPGTLGDAGILLPSKQPATVAAAVHRLHADAGLRARVLHAGERRLAEFSLTRTRARWREVLQSAELVS